MDYEQALAYLYRLHRTGMKLRLSHTRELLRRMGDPHRRFKSVLVGGTNGKGSVCAMVYSVLREAGVRAGLYTSPHLMEFTERITVGGGDIPRRVFARLLEEAVPLIDDMRADPKLGEPTFFEVVTALAFKYFAEQEIDFAVVEVGLGGGLDASNVLAPEVSVITNVQWDHTEILGNSLAKIARKKAGIIKERTPVVTSECKEEALAVIEEACRRKKAPLYIVGKNVTYVARSATTNGQKLDVTGIRDHRNLAIPLLGSHQLANAATAVTALDLLNERGIRISPEHIKRGLSSASWPGRFEILNTTPTIILDCAHNPPGAETLEDTLTAFYGNKKHVFVLGVSDYKDVDGILGILAPKMKAAVTAKSQHPKAASPAVLCEKLTRLGIPCTPASSVAEAASTARALASKDDVIVFAGSIFFVGDARKILTTQEAHKNT